MRRGSNADVNPKGWLGVYARLPLNPLSNTRRMGREMAERVKQLGIDAVILTST